MHQVIFRSLLVRHYSWQYVKHGENTIPPMLDDVEGYYFAGWNKPYTNITENTEIEAVYWQYGDANMDEKLNTGDAVMVLLRYVEN